MELDEKTLDKIIGRIRKLQAKAKGTSNAEEAAAFAAGASRLMARYNIALHQIEEKPVLIEEFHFAMGTNRLWHKNLLDVLARHNYCKFLFRNRTHVFILIGEKHNADLVRELYEFLVRELDNIRQHDWSAALARFYDANPGKMPQMTKTTWGNNFFHGAVLAIDERLSAARKAAEKDEAIPEEAEDAIEGLEAPTGSQMRALVVVQDAAIKEFVAKNHPKLHVRPVVKIIGSSGLYEGYQAGQKVQLHKLVKN